MVGWALPPVPGQMSAEPRSSFASSSHVLLVPDVCVGHSEFWRSVSSFDS